MSAVVPLSIVLTGSSTGIGQALAQRLLARGHCVWGLARREQNATPNESPGSTAAFQASRCDVADWSQVEQAARSVAAKWPHVDALIACAGVQGEIGPVLSADPSRWCATVRTDLDGTFHAIRAFAELLSRAPRRRKIVCFSGGGATKARPHFSAYGVAKTAVVRLVETVAAEESRRSLDINAVAPGAIYTAMTEEVIALGPQVAGEAEYQSALKQKESGDAPLAKALDLVEWLLSPASDGVSGRLISAQWDDWKNLPAQLADSTHAELYTLRRITTARG